MTERDVLLFRHGPAEDHRLGLPDADRALTAAGRHTTAAAARGLTSLLETDPLIVTSPARRARETADILAAAWPGARLECDERLAPGASPQALRASVLARPATAPLLLVGHEPDLSGFLAALLEAPSDTRFKFGKAGVAWLRCAVALDTPATLRLLLTRRVLGRLAS